ncbi:MAG: N-acetylmuramoyl-L-alanine amidase [Verrucomicrobia bacterium]|nr:N-acetylmuramoyl-L-alanine amidase [Verrucomicrobiota bacterium]
MRRWLLWTVTGLAMPMLLAGCRANSVPNDATNRRAHKAARTRGPEGPDGASETEAGDPGDEPCRWRISTVCIDAGHGGSDTGTQTDGAAEKTIVLDLALRVRDALEAEGLTVVMTRETDHTVSRTERAAICNRTEAGVFLSIHCNGYHDPAVSGVEVYYLGRGASAETSHLATLVHDALVEAVGARDRGIRPAGFTVLAGTHCPAVLVEVGYLSNDNDRARLLDETGRQAIAAALAAAVITFAENDTAAPSGAAGRSGAATGTE